MIIFFILLLLVPCLTIRKQNDAENIMNYRATTCLKGVLCLFVMFHNLALDYYPNDGSIYRLIAEHAGGVAVGLFFFLSAFGIIRAYQAKGNKFLLKLIFVNVVKLYIISVVINLLIYFVYFQGAFTTEDTLMRIFNLDIFNNFNRMNRHGWFIPTIIGMYLIFALVYYLFSKLKTQKKFIFAGILLSIIAISLRIAAIVFDNGGMYTREITAFATGTMYATFYKQINMFLNKYFWWCFVVSFVSMIIGFFCFEPVATHAAALFLITIAQKITWENPILYFLGKICLSVYLFLYFSTLTLQSFITNAFLWTILNGTFILALSTTLYAFEFGITRLVKYFINKHHSKDINNNPSIEQKQES